MKFLKILVVFLIVNFGALGLGTLFMASGPQGEWYAQLNKAPWTPDGWVFGVAWTTIMICFSLYMTFLCIKRLSNKVITLFVIQFLLNISWNYIFFNQKLTDIALINITLLTIVVTAFFITYLKELKLKSLLILPYVIWLCIATSLNLYISIYN
ncbi:MULTISPECIES: TspO/MBR family protein [Flavobacteriaceae]|uniref:Tryptophan-rich sensory protein n=2 Tax=Flavobacteriaceae TaxID=49546 RepID=A0ABN1JXM7_9FLAO|nr:MULTISPECIES: TspO/MBR family protein [Meridianimaribacter]TBV24720.1 tryptophan-rich sensory protein [Meridianimaribacter sp. CL38]TDY05505.1 TspO/MBR related protein [Meridianimaribacter flavus]